MTHRSAGRHEPRDPGDATIIRPLARHAMAAPRRHRPPGGHLTSSPECLRGHRGGQSLVAGVDGADDAPADLAQLPGLGLGQRVEYQVLALLSEAPGRTLRMSELAKWAGSSLPRLSQVVARLEQRGWVQRTPDLADGRYTLATLTGQGQAKVTQAAPGHVQEVRRLVFDPLTKTQSRQLREIGQRITRAIDPGDQPVPAAMPAQAPQ